MKAIDREQQAEAEIGHTTVSRGVPLFLTVFVLVIIAGVFVLERLDPDGVPLVDDLLHLPPSVADISDTVAREGAYEAFFFLNKSMLGNMERLASDLERSSPLRNVLLSPMNRYLTGHFGAQNAEVLRGRDGWLFYAPAVAHLTGPGFLTGQVARRGDPVEALAAFRDQLAERGIALVVMPLPVKASIHPEQFSAKAPADTPIQNTSHESFVAALNARGLLTCDVSNALMAAKTMGPVYLARDSHWTPEGMHAAAAALQAFLREHVPSLPAGNTTYRAAAPATIEHAGDLAVMLAPEDAARYGMNESIQHVGVEGPDGAPWTPDSSAKLLLLGDSFANIFELEGMGWGAHGGLAAWLSLLMQQPVDSITQNGDGAHATRQRLIQALERGQDRLSGKKVLVFAFAARELSLGDWKPELRLPKVIAQDVAPPTSDLPVTVSGTVGAFTTPPEPGTAPYKDCLIATRITGVTGAPGLPESLVVYRWGMRDNTWTDAARQRPGDAVRITIQPWSTVTTALDGFNRIDLDDMNVSEGAIWWEIGDLPVPGARQEARSNIPVANAPLHAPDLETLVQGLAGFRQMVHTGHNGWLFFTPELESLAAQPVWTKSENAPAAILDFHTQLRARDIELLLVPVPAKGSIYGDQLQVDAPLAGAPTWIAPLYTLLRAEGVEVLDHHDAFVAARREGGADLYCRQDTHWSSRASALAASEIAAWIAARTPQAVIASYEVDEESITMEGDLRAMLPDPKPAPETIALQRIRSGMTATDPASPVVLMGDSHALVFHAGGDMHAEGAGLPDHLAAALGQPVDLVAVRGSGANAPRVNLARRRDNLAGKKLVIWCFTLRELTESSNGWRPIPVITPATAER